MAVRVHKRDAGEPPSALTAEVEQFVVTDTRGRRITIRKPPFLAQFRLTKILGDAAANATYLTSLTPILYVQMIDDEPVGFPQSEREAEGVLAMLDADGYDAVLRGMVEHWGSEDAKEKLESEAKNS